MIMNKIKNIKEKDIKLARLKVLAKKKESIRRKLEVTAEKLVVTAKEKESVRKKLVVVAKQLALLAKEKEYIRKNLAVTAKELAVAAAKEKAILASIGDAVVACDKDGRIVLFNRVAEELSGFTFKEASGRHYGRSIRFVRERDGKPSNDFIAEVIKTGRKAVMVNHTLLIRKDGSRIPVADSAAPVEDAEGKLIGCVVVFRDVTKEREIDKAKTEFVSLASHQLKTPPTAVKWLTEMILEDKTSKLTEKQKGYLGEVHSKNEQMIELVNSLLDVSRLELGTLAVTPVPTNINQLVKGVIEGLRIQINAKDLSLKEKYNKDKLVISTDANLLQIVVHNLLTNAINYTPKNGEITVEASSKRNGGGRQKNIGRRQRGPYGRRYRVRHSQAPAKYDFYQAVSRGQR